MRIRTKILLILSSLWMVFIFFMSAQTSKTSTYISDGVTAVVVDIMYGDEKPKNYKEAGLEWDDAGLSAMIEKGLVPKDDLFGRNKFDFKNDIRKIAHIVMFFVLAILVNVSFISHFGKNRLRYIAATACVCTLYAGFDELHQYFVPGRGAQLSDVGIDCIGVLMGIALVAGVCAVIRLVEAIRNRCRQYS